jgi:hypothetical protein
MTTAEQNEFKGKFSLLMDCRAMNNKNWLEGEVKHRTKKFLQLWQHKQKGIVYTISLVMYVQLKEDRKGTQKEVLEAAKEEDINTFMVIKSDEKHHAIINERGVILGHRYRVKPELLETLKETTVDLPHMGVNTSKRGNYLTCHYTVWHDYSKEPYKSADYQKELPASKEWCDKNSELFEYLFDGLWTISPMTYMRYGGARHYLQARHNLQPLCGIWFGVAINEAVTSSTSTYLDFNDSGYNCVVP